MGPGKDREFVHVPTASAETGRFTWAVPIGHTERAEDRAIRSRAARILSAYRRAAAAIKAAQHPMQLVRELNEAPIVR